MTTATVAPPTDAEIADVLDKAADEIARRGLHKGEYFDETAVAEGNATKDDCKVCALGALEYALIGDVDDMSSLATIRWGHPKYDLFLAAIVVLDDASDTGSIPEYNDHDDTTQDDVVGLFRNTVARLREGK